MTSIRQPSRDEAIRLMRGGLANAMMEIAAGYVMPICWITARQGSVGLELEEQAPDLDTLLVAVGGGGLIGGIAA